MNGSKGEFHIKILCITNVAEIERKNDGPEEFFQSLSSLPHLLWQCELVVACREERIRILNRLIGFVGVVASKLFVLVFGHKIKRPNSLSQASRDRIASLH